MRESVEESLWEEVDMVCQVDKGYENVRCQEPNTLTIE